MPSAAAKVCATCIGRLREPRYHTQLFKAAHKSAADSNWLVNAFGTSLSITQLIYQPHTRIARPRGKRGHANASLCTDRLVAILGHSMGACLKHSVFCLSRDRCGCSMAECIAWYRIGPSTKSTQVGWSV